jgi:uncharacterized protein YerC
MPKIKKGKISLELKVQSLDILLKRISEIDTISKLDKLLDDFFTEREKEIILRRLAAIVLLKKKIKYRDIENMLDISRATISRAKQIISGDGYGKNLKKKTPSQSFLPKKKEKRKKLLPPYKGAESII